MITYDLIKNFYNLNQMNSIPYKLLDWAIPLVSYVIDSIGSQKSADYL